MAITLNHPLIHEKLIFTIYRYQTTNFGFKLVHNSISVLGFRLIILEKQRKSLACRLLV